MFIPLPFRKLIVMTGCLYVSLSGYNAWPVDMVFGGSIYNMNVESLKDRRFDKVIRQEWDFSCGSAALATLLKYNYGREGVEEKSVLAAMLEKGDREQIRKEGFSMLDMKNYLAGMGFEADGYRVSLDRLKEVGIPAIALINKNGYMHFVVLNGMDRDTVIIRDPAFGNRTMERDDFEKIWNGILFVITSNQEMAGETFEHEHTWNTRKKDLSQEILNAGPLTDLALQSVFASNYFNF